MRLIESARTRLTTQLKERLRSLAIESSAKSGFSESDSMNIVVRQYPGSEKTAQIDGGSPTIIQEAQALLTGH